LQQGLRQNRYLKSIIGKTSYAAEVIYRLSEKVPG